MMAALINRAARGAALIETDMAALRADGIVADPASILGALIASQWAVADAVIAAIRDRAAELAARIIRLAESPVATGRVVLIRHYARERYVLRRLLRECGNAHLDPGTIRPRREHAREEHHSSGTYQTADLAKETAR